MPPLTILSLGAGVQSTTIARMSFAGELPPIDHAIFADTGWERGVTHEHLAGLREEFSAAGVPLHVVQADSGLRSGLIASVDGTRYAGIPVHVKNKDGTKGMGRRQCTREYKIAPIKKKVRELIGVKEGERIGKKRGVLAVQWLGISLEEVWRMKDSGAKWWENEWPLVYIKPMRRHECIAWNIEHGFGEPPRSACVGCPFQGAPEWSDLKPDEIENAAQVEDAIQAQGWDGTPFLHPSCKPLREIDLRNDIQRGQETFWPMECDGICGT